MITEVRDTILVPLEEFNSETIASTALDPVSREVNALSKEILSSQNPIPVPREKQGRSRKTTLIIGVLFMEQSFFTLGQMSKGNCSNNSNIYRDLGILAAVIMLAAIQVLILHCALPSGIPKHKAKTLLTAVP